jgi:ATP-dependent RNA helicase DeaD
MAMSGLTDLHLAPAVAAALESFGYGAADAAVRDQVPTAARGHNLGLAWPPAARYAAPALAGLVSAQLANGSHALVVAPGHALAEWANVLLPLAQAAGLSTVVAETPARATRRLRDGALRLLLSTPATALSLLERSALKVDKLGHVVLAWPEQFESDDALTALMQDLPAEAQRIVVLAEPRSAHPLLERYARRCHVCGPLGVVGESETPARPPARILSVGWSQRGLALAGLLETEDPETVTVWCADQRSVTMAAAALPAGDASIQVVTGEPPAAGLIVAWDLPTPDRLNQLRRAGDLVLLSPPHAAGYLRRVTSVQNPVRIPGILEAARHEAARRRNLVATELQQGGLDVELLALAPLFERFDATAVASALYRLWRKGSAEPAAAPAEAADASPSRVWVSAGKKDGTTAADLVAVLNREIGVPAGKIGRIEIRELFSLVEVPAAEAEEIARRLSGKTVRRRSVTAKVDRGAPARR